MPSLFEPHTQRGVTFRNRVAVSPMCQYCVGDGLVGDWHLVHLGSRAAGGAGLVMAEATAVVPEGRITLGDTGLWSDDHAERFARVARFIKTQNAVPGIQLAHAGRKASCAVPQDGGEPLTPGQGAWQTVAPSAIPFRDSDPVPKALDQVGIDALLDAFDAATDRAVGAGFEVIELHAAHGYLFHEFLSPISNERRDQYGGSFENRARLLVTVARRTRARIPERMPLWVRVSATDWVDGGWDVDQSVELARLLKTAGVDLIDTSSGGMVPHAKIPTAPGYQVPAAGRIKREAGIETGAVGLITEAHQAQAILDAGDADVILLAREMLRDPYWALHAAEELGEKASWPRQYGYAVAKK